MMRVKRMVLGVVILILGGMLFNCPTPTSPTASNEARLSALTVSAGILDPAFDEDTVSYTLAVDNAVNAVTLAPTTRHAQATVAFSKNSLALSDGTIPLDTGLNQVEIRVTAENGTSTMTYSLAITRDDGKSLFSFVFEASANPGLGSDCIGVIHTDDTITATVPFGTNVTALVAGFTTSPGAVVTVGAADQTSGVTPNNFTSAVTYTVTAADSSTREYTVTVDIAPNNAKDFTVFRFEAANNPGLAADAEGVIGTDAVTVTLPYGSSRSGLVATFSSSGVSVAVGGAVQTSGVTANDFTSPVTYAVSAADASVKQYTVTVTVAAPSANANLAGLTLSAGSLAPAFDPAITSYTVAIANPATATVTVTPTVAESHATCVLRKNGSPVTNPLALDLGLNTITVAVTAQDGLTGKTYTMEIRRGTAVAGLSNLTISVGTLSPVFSTTTLAYSVFESTEISSLTLTPTATDSYATCVVRKNGIETSNPVPLSAGNAALTVVVTSSDQSATQTYTVNITVPQHLTVKTWAASSLAANEEKWFYFVNTDAKTTKYAFNWNDSAQGSGAYTCNITGAAYHPDRTTAYFANVNNGYTLCQKISVPAGETVYFKAQGYLASSAGTFAVRYAGTEWNAAVDPVFEMDFGSNTSLDLDILNPGGKQLYMVKANVSTSSAGSTTTGFTAQINGESLLQPSKEKADISSAADSLVRRDPEKVSKFSNSLPAPSKVLKSQQNLLPEFLVNYGDDAGAGYIVGTTTKTLWTLGANEGNETVDATLRAIGDYCYVWVPDLYYDNGSAASTDNKITQTQIDALVTNFDNIFGWETNVFGYEFGGGPGGNGGRDEDQHISILVYDIMADYTSGQTGGVFGYFAPYDNFSQQELNDKGLIDLRTNYMEIFYIDCHFTDLAPSYIYSTLTHEYQHMIQFNRKYITHGLSSPTWYNEMCSMVAEDFLRTKLGISTQASPQSRFGYFNYAYDLSGVIDWLNGDYVLYSYATAYAFGAFLSRNYGGVSLFSSMLTNSQTGTGSVAAAVQAQGYALTFDDLFKQYATAFVFETEAAPSVKVFNKAYSGSLNGIPYDLNAINIYQYRQLNNPANPLGPWTYTPSYQATLRPYGNSVHTKSAWDSLTADTTFSVTAPTDPDVKIYFMLK